MKKSLFLIIGLIGFAGLSFAFDNPVKKETRKGVILPVEVVIEGSLSMFSYDSEVLNATIPEDPLASYTEVRTTYFIGDEGSDNITEVSCANYRKVLKSHMSDNPQLMERIGKKGHKFKDIEKIVTAYNSK